MSDRATHLRWGRIVLAGIAAQFIDDIVFRLVPFSGWLLAPFAMLVTLGLTALFALWVARSVHPVTALKHGTMVGVVAGAVAFIIALPSLWAPLTAAFTLGAGALGGLAGQQIRRARPVLEGHEPGYSAQ